MGAPLIPDWFLDRMGRLVGLKFAPATMDTHWEALSDLSTEELDAAVGRAQRECDEFPSPKMLRSFASQAVRVGPDEDRSELVEHTVIPFPQAGRDLHVTREWKFYCDTCRDMGWESFHCDGNRACGRQQCFYSHEYVQHCNCWNVNPALIKKRQRAAQQAHTRMAKGE